MIPDGVKNLRVLMGKNEWSVPIEPVGCVVGRSCRSNRSSFTCFEMSPTKRAVLTFRIDQIGILLIHLANEAIAAADGQPVFIECSAVLADGWSSP